MLDRVSAVLVLLGFMVGCQGAKSPSAGGAERFTFEPRPNTAFERTAKWTREVTFVGSPLKRTESFTFIWDGNIAPEEGRGYVLDERLRGVTLALDGKDVASIAPAPDHPIRIKVSLDKQGVVTGIDGTDAAAASVQSLAGREFQGAAEREVLRQALDEMIAARVEQVITGLNGKPAAVGSSWTETIEPAAMPGQPQEVAAAEKAVKRTYTVAAIEKCAFGECARVDAKLAADPNRVAKRVQATVDELVGKPVVDVRAAKYQETSSLVVDPRTMMPLGSKDEAEGEFVFAGPSQKEIPVRLRITREVTHTYTTPSSTR